MKVFIDAQREVALHPMKKKKDDEIVREELVRVWTKILEKYAKPGAAIPSTEEVRKELIRKGVDAAVSALESAHWFVFSWMIRDEIRAKVERGLDRFSLEDFLSDVYTAQHNPEMLQSLREQIRHYVLHEEFA